LSSCHPFVKFRKGTPTTPKVTDAHTWNFKPNFKCWHLKFWGDPRPSLQCALARLCQSLARVKISVANTPYGPKYSLLKKGDLGGSKLTCTTLWIVDRTSFAVCRNNRSRSHIFPILDTMTHSCDIRDESRKLCKIDPKFRGGKKILGEDPLIFGLALKR